MRGPPPLPQPSTVYAGILILKAPLLPLNVRVPPLRVCEVVGTILGIGVPHPPSLHLLVVWFVTTGALLVVGDVQSLVSEAVTDVRIKHPSVPVVSHMTTVVDASNLRLHNPSDIILIIILPVMHSVAY